MAASVPKRVKMAVLASSGKRKVHRAAATGADPQPAAYGFVKGLRPGVFAGWTDSRGIPSGGLEALADEALQQWHHSAATIEAHEYMGLTRAEYAKWVQSASIGPILRARTAVTI